MSNRDLAIERTDSNRIPSAEFALHAARYVFCSQFIDSGTVLDVACGTGFGTSILSTSADHCTGLDVDADVIENAKLTFVDSKITFVEGDCQVLPFSDASFDLIVSIETIEHLTDPDIFLSELSRCLKPGGRLVISTPNRNYKMPWVRNVNPFHINEWSIDDFTKTIENRFGNIEVYTQWGSSLQRIIGNTLWTGAELLKLLPASFAAKIVSGYRKCKLMIFRSSPAKLQNEIPVDMKDTIRRYENGKSSGINVPHTIIIVADSRVSQG